MTSEIGYVKRILCGGLAMTLSSCVDTVAYQSLPSSYVSAQRALVAERVLIHPQTVAIRQVKPGYEQIRFCSGEGAEIVVDSPQVTTDGICGRAAVYSNAAGSPFTAERCWAFTEISSIGEPRDATTIGYYAVRGYLRCPH